MARPLRVLQVATVMNRGGLETFIMNMYRNMNREEIQFDFLLHRNQQGIYDEEIRDLGGRIYRVPRANPLDPHYYGALNRFFMEHDYHIVHSHIDCMSALPLDVARKNGVPVRIAHSHSSRQDIDAKYPIKILLKNRIRHVATHLFACGVDAGRWMFGTDEFQVIHNAIDTDSFRFDEDVRNCMRDDLGIMKNTLVVGHVGRFNKVKNHSFLVRSFAELLRDHHDALLVLVGTGDLQKSVMDEVREYGISDNVRFLGLRDDVAHLMQAFDVFVMPSLYEGLPLVLVEAQASGLPCVISENIPSDCDITPAITRMTLSSGPKAWAEKILEAKQCERVRGFDYVRAAGFDAQETATELQEFYLRYSRS